MAAIIVGGSGFATLDSTHRHGYPPRPAMAIRFVEIHAAPNPAELNTEWVILENDGKLPFVTRGCGMTVGRRGQARRKELGIIDPGFVLKPGERVRMLTGSPGAKDEGTPPDDGVDGVTNYYLLLPKPYLAGAGTVLTLTLRGQVVSKAEFDPAAATGVAAK
jgi:hypothetical protein